MIKKILFIGPQGSGKSTQGKLLSKYLNLQYLSTGDIFREISKENTQLGERVRNFIKEGQLVDDQTTCEVVKKKLKKEEIKMGFIMDGYPRTVKQAEIFDPGFDIVFYLRVSKHVSLDRLLKRVREDDTPTLIEARLVYYYKQTEPLLGYYKGKGILKEIDAEKDIKSVQSEIRNILEDTKDEASK